MHSFRSQVKLSILQTLNVSQVVGRKCPISAARHCLLICTCMADKIEALNNLILQSVYHVCVQSVIIGLLYLSTNAV